MKPEKDSEQMSGQGQGGSGWQQGPCGEKRARRKDINEGISQGLRASQDDRGTHRGMRSLWDPTKGDPLTHSVDRSRIISDAWKTSTAGVPNFGVSGSFSNLKSTGRFVKIMRNEGRARLPRALWLVDQKVGQTGSLNFLH